MQNSRSSIDKLWISLKSNKSKRTRKSGVQLHLILSSALESEKMMIPEKSSSASIKPARSEFGAITVVIGVPDGEGGFVGAEDALELSQVDGEVVADALEAAV